MIKCPNCGESYYQEKYSVTTCMYSPAVFKDGKLISKDPNYTTTQCHCLNCGADFAYRKGPDDDVLGDISKTPVQT